MRHALYCALCAVLTILLLALSFRYVTNFWLFSFFFSFTTHLGLAAIAGSLLAILLKRSTFPVVLLLVALAITGHSLVMRQEFLADTSRPVPEVSATFRLLSLNVLFTNWKGAAAITDEILASGADVVYLLEGRPMKPRLKKLDEAYPYRIGCGIATQTCDLIVLSKHPFTAQTYINLSDLRSDRFAIVDIEIGGRTVHFAAAHLTKPYYDDYHTDELIMAASIIQQTGGEFIIAGDFNSASIAPDMQDFLRNLDLRTGPSEPATWPVIAGPLGIPIDHVFATKGIRITRLESVQPNGSNHLGLVADMVLLPAP